MLRILQVSDFHLDYPFPLPDGAAESRRQDQLKTFERVVNLAIKSEVDLLLIAGNLFASPRPQHSLVELVSAQLRRLVERRIVPVLLPGSRDGILTPDNVYRLVAFPGVLLSDLGQLRRPVSIDAGRAPVHLYGFVWGSGGGDAGSLVSLKRREQPGFHLGVLQACLEGDEEATSFRALPAVNAETIRGWNLDYVALGNRRNWLTLPAGEGVLAAFAGTPEGLDFGESGPRHCALVTLTGGTAQVEPIAVNSRRLDRQELDLGEYDDPQNLTARVGELSHPDLLLRVRLTGKAGCLVEVDQLQKELGERFAWLDIEDRSEVLSGAYGEALKGEGGSVAGLVEHARQLLGQAGDGEDRLCIEKAFRKALAHLRAHAGGQS